LAAYDYPGNVRELENVLERAMALATGDSIDGADLRLTPLLARARARGGGGTGDTRDAAEAPSELSLQESMDHAERELILAALEACGQNRTAAAKRLGVTFRSLRYRLQRLNIAD